MGFDTLLSQSMKPFTIYASLFFLFCLLFWLLKRSHADKPTKSPLPPEASGSWPLIGHLHLIGGSQPAHVILGNMADKYGLIFTLHLGVHRTLVVSNWKMAKECFTVNDKVFPSRPNSLAFEVLGVNCSLFGTGPYGPYWHYVRKIATQEVLSTKRIEMVKQVMHSKVKAAMTRSYDFWVMMNESGSKKSVTKMEKWFANITLNVMFRTVLGKQLTGMGDEDNEQENEKIRKAVRDFFHLFGQFTVSDAVPFLRWLDFDGYEKKMKKSAKELDD